MYSSEKTKFFGPILTFRKNRNVPSQICEANLSGSEIDSISEIKTLFLSEPVPKIRKFSPQKRSFYSPQTFGGIGSTGSTGSAGLTSLTNIIFWETLRFLSSKIQNHKILICPKKTPLLEVGFLLFLEKTWCKLLHTP